MGLRSASHTKKREKLQRKVLKRTATKEKKGGCSEMPERESCKKSVALKKNYGRGYVP